MSKVLFLRSNDLGGWIIRLLTFSKWNHVAIEIDGYVYEALTSKGVVKVPKHQYWQWDEEKCVTVPINNSEAVKQFLDNQVGKGYDWKALVALPFLRKWHHPDKWFCSELVAEALLKGGSGFTEEDLPSYRVTPKDLHTAVSWNQRMSYGNTE